MTVFSLDVEQPRQQRQYAGNKNDAVNRQQEDISVESSLQLDQYQDNYEDAVEALRSAEISSMEIPSSPTHVTITRNHASGDDDDEAAKALQHHQLNGNPKVQPNFIRRHCFRCYNQFAEHSPRIYAFVFGFVTPIVGLVVLASLCGYPLALLEAPLEVENNDFILENQMRLVLEASLYTNLTLALPRICVQLFFLNSTIDEFLLNVTAILDGPPTEDEVSDFVEASLGKNETEPVLELLLLTTNETFISSVNDSLTDFNATIMAMDTTTAMTTNATMVGASPAVSVATSSSSVREETTATLSPEELAEQVNERVDTIVDELKEPFYNYYQYYTFELQDLPENETHVVNLTELSLFVENCGNGLNPLIDKMFVSLTRTVHRALEAPLGFAWNRCPMVDPRIPTSNDSVQQHFDLNGFYAFLLGNYLPANWTNVLQDTIQEYDNTTITQMSQSKFFRQQWEQDRRRLYVKYLEEAQSDGYNEAKANLTGDVDPAIWHRISAFERSLQEATGGGKCSPNIPASCWFWFTVMTTIGYGNTSPESFGGKCMVFTLGFVSMILFGFVSTRAAYVITSIFDDMLVRARLHCLTRPWIQCFIWGLAYYLWMGLIAYVYQWWKKLRMGESADSSFSTAYWFSYISTTTVGFGDYFLEPDVLQPIDCIIFPVIFLLGFSLLASFLTKLSVFATAPLNNGPSLTENFRVTDESRILRQYAQQDKTNASKEAIFTSNASDVLTTPN